MSQNYKTNDVKSEVDTEGTSTYLSLPIVTPLSCSLIFFQA